MQADVIPFDPRMSRNRALARLFKAEHELGRAGLGGEAVYGSAEDGAPWLAICDHYTGDVLVHIAVLDGQIVADSPAIDGAIRDRDLSTILRRLMEGLGRFQSQGILGAILASLTAHHHLGREPLKAVGDDAGAGPLIDALAALPPLVAIAQTSSAVMRFIVDERPATDRKADAEQAFAIELMLEPSKQEKAPEPISPPNEPAVGKPNISVPQLPALPHSPVLVLESSLPHFNFDTLAEIELSARKSPGAEAALIGNAPLPEKGGGAKPWPEPPMPSFSPYSKEAEVEITGNSIVYRFYSDVPYREWIWGDGSRITMVGTLSRPLETYYPD